MTSAWSAPVLGHLRHAWIALPLLVAIGCGDGFVPSDGAGSGGTSTSGGQAGADDQAGGGSANDASGDGGTNTGGSIATDAPEYVGGSPSTGGEAGAGGNVSGTGKCYDEHCDGICVGNCADGFTCDTSEIPVCAAVFTTVCGCDGETFSLPSACPSMGYAHEGSCEGPEDGYNCAPDDILCLPIVAPEPCPAGETYSVVNNCHGDCVPIERCACDSADDCPDPNGTDEYTCHNNTDRCGPWL